MPWILMKDKQRTMATILTQSKPAPTNREKNETKTEK